MKCEEVANLLHPYLDGELSPDEAAEVQRALADCPDCSTELAEMETVRALAREAFEAPAQAADLSGTFDAVMARLEAEGALREAPSTAAAPRVVVAPEGPGLIERFGAWLGELVRFERPVAAFAVAAALAVAVGTLWWANQPGTPGAGVGAAPTVAEGGDEPESPAIKRPRRGMEAEVTVAGRHAATVESFEVAEGRVVIDDNADDPDSPLVVWHFVDENGEASVEQGL